VFETLIELLKVKLKFIFVDVFTIEINTN